MKVEVETKSIQVIEQKEDVMVLQGSGNIENYEKGIILTWKIPKEQLEFKMTILEDKILLKKQNQNMIFELGKKTKSSMQTPYGNILMDIVTNHIEIIKQEENIRKILLEYDIIMEETTRYQNKIEIVIK